MIDFNMLSALSPSPTRIISRKLFKATKKNFCRRENFVRTKNFFRNSIFNKKNCHSTNCTVICCILSNFLQWQWKYEKYNIRLENISTRISWFICLVFHINFYTWHDCEVDFSTRKTIEQILKKDFKVEKFLNFRFF